MNPIVRLGGGLVLAMMAGRLLDPHLGRRRRALIRDQAVSAVCMAGRVVDTTSRDLVNRTRGVIAILRSRLSREEPTPAVLAERVRAEIGGSVTHPGSIAVEVDDRRVALRGPILTDEVDTAVRRVASVRGVRSVINELDMHDTPGDIPGLQGQGRPRQFGRFELFQSHWSPTARLLTAVAGGAVGLWGLRQRSVIGTALGAAGLTLVARAVTDLELKRLFGIGAGFWAVTIQKTITVAAPIEEVFEVWSRYEEFPRFMRHVREARRVDDDRVRWTVAGPAGVPIHWETEETRRIPYEVIAWKTVPGAPVAHAGVVRFDDDPAGTRVHVTMRYNPPAGALGHALATILGADPKRALDEDLLTFKSLLEDGKTSVRGEVFRREALG